MQLPGSATSGSTSSQYGHRLSKTGMHRTAEWCLRPGVNTFLIGRFGCFLFSFYLGEGKGESRATGRGRGRFHKLNIPGEGGGSPRKGGGEGGREGVCWEFGGGG